MARRRKTAKAVAPKKTGPGGPTGPVIDTDLPVNWLDGVVVRQLEATPTSIPAFGAATLRWDVEAGPPVRLSLGGMRISRSGSMVINPTQTHAYRLMAFHGSESRFLGEVTVAVVHDACAIVGSANVDEFLATALKAFVNSSGELYFRHARNDRGQIVPSEPVVTIADHRIDFSLKLGSPVDWFPDPSIDVHASFGLRVDRDDDPVMSAVTFAPRTKLVATDVNVSVNVNFPWYAYAIPTGPVALPIVESMTEDKIRALAVEGIAQFVSELRFVSPGRIAHAVRIYAEGIVEVEFCPPPRPAVVGRG